MKKLALVLVMLVCVPCALFLAGCGEQNANQSWKFWEKSNASTTRPTTPEVHDCQEDALREQLNNIYPRVILNEQMIFDCDNGELNADVYLPFGAREKYETVLGGLQVFTYNGGPGYGNITLANVYDGNNNFTGKTASISSNINSEIVYVVITLFVNGRLNVHIDGWRANNQLTSIRLSLINEVALRI